MNILLGVTGSVAAIRAHRLADALTKLGTVQLVATPSAIHFLERAEEPRPASVELFVDADEWKLWNKLGDPVLHIELRNWADVLLVAPASADFIAKTAGGFSDNLLLSVCRAWDFSKPFLLAPAMNTMMWEHPASEVHLRVLRRWGVQAIDPVSKDLACGDVGIGGMAGAEAILKVIKASGTA